MAKILDGRIVCDILREDLKLKVRDSNKKKGLAIIQVGDRSDSSVYVRNKKNFGESIGVPVLIKKFDADVAEKMLLVEIERLNSDKDIGGIIVQMPLPEYINPEVVLHSIDKTKDADGLRNSSEDGGVFVTPATGRAVEELLNFYEIKISGRNAVVIGRSRLAGGPIAEMLERHGAKVMVCHKETQNIPVISKEADILVSATGVPALITKDYVKEGQVIIDVGISRVGDRIVGDVAFDEVEPIVAAISPVPGGVGPLTVACLFQNLLDLSML